MRAADVERDPHAPGDDVDHPRLDLDLADRRDRPVAGLPRQPLELERDLGGDRQRVDAHVHRRRARVVVAAGDLDVAVDVARDRLDHADLLGRVLEHPALLDVALHPGADVVEHAGRLLPAHGLVAGLLGVLEERPPVVDRPEALAQVGLLHAVRADAAAEEHLAEAGALLLEEGDQPQRQLEPVLGGQPADLEGDHHAERPVPRPAVAVGVAVRAEGEDGGAGRHVLGDERADRVLPRVEAELAEPGDEPVERGAVLRRVGVAADRALRARVGGAGEVGDGVRDPPPRALAVDREVGLRDRHQAAAGAAAGAASVVGGRSTKRPWPGCVRISPRSKTTVPRHSVVRTLPATTSPS